MEQPTAAPPQTSQHFKLLSTTRLTQRVPWLCVPRSPGVCRFEELRDVSSTATRRARRRCGWRRRTRRTYALSQKQGPGHGQTTKIPSEQHGRLAILVTGLPARKPRPKRLRQFETPISDSRKTSSCPQWLHLTDRIYRRGAEGAETEEKGRVRIRFRTLSLEAPFATRPPCPEPVSLDPQVLCALCASVVKKLRPPSG